MVLRHPSADFIAEKNEHIEEIEHTGPAQETSKLRNEAHGDAALAILRTPEVAQDITPEQDAAVLRKVDKWLIPVMSMVYFIQQLDKSSLSYTSVFGIVSDTHLVGSQYSWLGSIVYVAQLIWQPVSSYLLVRLPVGKYLFANVFAWGVVVSCTAAAHNFSGLLATRFFLGIFEATVAPSFITITQMWWRRREQTIRLSFWQAMNGVTAMVGSLLAFGIGHIGGLLDRNPVLTGLILSGTESKTWEWSQVREVLADPKTYLWIVMQFACALPSGGISTFGPLIIKGFGFNQFYTILFNIPFGALQVIITLSSATIATKLKLKWPVLFFLTLPPIAGASALYMFGREVSLRNKLLGCYYVLSFFTGIQPMINSWVSQNTAGHTKKTCTTGIVYVAQCTGNIVGPLLYRTVDAPHYHRGLVSNIACWAALAVLTPTMALYLSFKNKQHAAARHRAGKKVVVIDASLEDSKAAREAAKKNNTTGEEVVKRRLNDQAFNDLTDLQNEDFIYVL
ncbi:hypothetical protein FS749_012677 [Ceratobasidium sp. UAMH 11750]|nr:hypothetical protein FS749_012677 [Ceratobasidium sp. UAMH 11750]